MVKGEISRELLKYFELNENENITYQNAQDTAKTKLKIKFIAPNLYIRKENPKSMFPPYKNIKIRANKIISKQTKTNDKNQQKSMIMKTGNQERKSTKPKSCSLKQSRSMRGLLARPTKKQREKTQITNIRNENEDTIQIPWPLKG